MVALLFLIFSISFNDYIIILKQEKRREIKAYEVNKNTIIGDILDQDFDAAPFFLEMGMHCLGCPASRGETIAEACEVHGTDADELVKKLNEYFASK